jgi:DNA-binding NtrC family response regulator
MHHILIVDDDESIIELFQRYFEYHGFRVSVTQDMGEAIRIAESDVIDGVITDYRMPKMNGDELLNRLRQNQPDLPAIIVSGYSGTITPNLHHHTRIFPKPVEMTKLLNCLQRLLNERPVSD